MNKHYTKGPFGLITQCIYGYNFTPELRQIVKQISKELGIKYHPVFGWIYYPAIGLIEYIYNIPESRNEHPMKIGQNTFLAGRI